MCRFGLSLALGALVAASALGQDRLRTWRVSERQAKDNREQTGLIQDLTVETRWVAADKLAYKKGDQWRVLSLPKGTEEVAKEEPKEPPTVTSRSNANRGRRQPARGGQFTESFSEDGKVRAFYKDSNLWLQSGGGEPRPVTTDGSVAGRIKYGQASWVYGEELDQRDAMGVNPGGTKAWYYRFDERPVVDNIVVLRQATPRPEFEPQAFPKPGTLNPVVDLFVVDVATGTSVPIRVRPGAFDNGVGHYVYDVHWAPDGTTLMFRRTDRRQKTMEFCAADADTGTVRVLVSESWPASYYENRLGVWYCDQQPDIGQAAAFKGKALWETQRDGHLNFGILDLKTGGYQPVTANTFDATRMVRLDLVGKKLWYMGRGADNPYFEQLYVVGLDGKGNRRVTDPSINHSVRLSPDGRWIVDVVQTCQDPPVTRLIDLSGKVVKELGRADVSQYLAAGYSLPERIVYSAADGKTLLHGVVRKPRHFDPNKKYPLLVSVYGGPGSPRGSGFSETFSAYDAATGYGFVRASFDNRGLGGRGKAFADPMYRNMGIVEIDDQAAGAKALVGKGYIDPSQVGVYGTSYGGYSSVMAILRYPDLYTKACSSSCVSDWRNYDTIYTERYMDLLEENLKGYDTGSAMTYTGNLKGWLMLYFGTADDNTHPNNTLQLTNAFRRLGKTIEVQVGTDAGHSGIDNRRMMEFFIERMGVSKD